MKANQYQVIKHYISTLKYSKWMKTVGEKSKWWQKVKKLILIEGQLFHKEKKGQLTLVVQKYQVAIILYMIYDHPTGEYRGPGSMSQKIH